MPESVSDDLRNALDSAPTPIVLVDEAGRLAFANARAERVFGYSRVELLGAPAELVLPEWPRVARAIRTALSPNGLPGTPADGPTQQIERCVVLVTFTGRAGESDRSGHENALQTPAASPPEPLRPSGLIAAPDERTEAPFLLPGGAAVRTDVLCRHRDGHSFREPTTLSLVRAAGAPARTGGGDTADPPAATRHGAERFRAVFEATTAGMVEVTHDHRILTANAAFCRMTGYTPAELAGAPFSDVLFPEDRAQVLALFDGVAAGRASADEADRRHRRKDGSVLWGRVSARARRDDGRPPGVSAVLIDLTERMHLEEQVRRVQRADAVGLRASYLAHDFNNLLTIIGGCAEVLLSGLPEDGPTRRLVLEMASACQRAAGLTSQFLALGRTGPAEPRVVDLNEVATEAIRLLRRLLGPGITLADDLVEHLPGVTADPAQLERAILNLAINAKDAMPHGGVLAVETHVVRVGTEDRSAYPDLPPGEYVQLAVSDTGTGMPDEVKARAFEPFFTTKGVGKGTGLGLAAVHATVTQYGGRVDVYSELGAGTVFEILLPTAAAPALPPAHGSGLVPRCAGTVLVVERDGAIRRLARLALRAHGAAVLEAGNRAEGLELAGHHTGPIALVLAGADARTIAGTLRPRHPNICALSLFRGTEGGAVPVSDEPPTFVRKVLTPISLARSVRAALGATR